VGSREAEAGLVALRRLGSNEQQVVEKGEALSMLCNESIAPDLVDKQ
jgi:threonyl-tRNA synthetase